MNILNKIIELLKEQGKTQRQLCDHLGLKQQAFTNWKNGHTDSWKKYLPQIAEYLGVSVDFLLKEHQQGQSFNINNSGIIGNNNSNCLNASVQELGDIERELLNICAQLDIKRKNALLTRAYELLENK